MREPVIKLGIAAASLILNSSTLYDRQRPLSYVKDGHF